MDNCPFKIGGTSKDKKREPNGSLGRIDKFK